MRFVSLTEVFPISGFLLSVPSDRIILSITHILEKPIYGYGGGGETESFMRIDKDWLITINGRNLMRSKLMLLCLAVVVACGAGPFSRNGIPRGGYTPQLNPGVNGPGPGVIPSTSSKYNESAALGEAQPNAQINFQGAKGMMVSWDVSAVGAFDSMPRIAPFSQNFQLGRVYRLRLTGLPNRADRAYYPTLKINSVTPRTQAYLDHNAIPITFTDNDLDQVDSGNFVTKVIFLPAPEFQNLAIAGGVDTIVNTQLPAGADPVVEAQNRGSVLAVIQIGNKDLGLPGSYDTPIESASTSEADAPHVPQVPISGVNVPSFGTPNSVTAYGVPGPPVLPAAPEGVRQRVFYPVNPYPSTEIPGLQGTWSDIHF